MDRVDEVKVEDDEVKVKDDGDSLDEAYSAGVVVPPTHKPKDPRSKYKYNIFIRILYLWLDGIFVTGCQRTLEQSDLYAHPGEADSAKLLKSFTKYWLRELERTRRGLKPRLWVVIFKVFWWRILLQGILWFVETSVIIGQALVLGKITGYFSLPLSETVGPENLPFTATRDDPEQIRDVYLYAAGLVLMAFFIALIHSHSFLLGQKIGMMCRIMMTSAIYKKVLSLSQVTIGQVSVGHIVNLASNDVQRFDLAFMFVHTLWLSPLALIAITVILYIYIDLGPVALVPAVVTILQLPLQMTLAKLFGNFRFKSAKKTDKRVRIMNEVITGIRVIKMYAWEYAFKRVVNALRKHEVRFIRYGGIIRNIMTVLAFAVILQIMMGITFIIFIAVYGQGELTAEKVFSSLALLSLLRRVAGAFLVRNLFLLFEANVAVQRIQKFLLLDDIAPCFREDSSAKNGKVSFNSQVAEVGYFRPESPWLPGTRRVTGDPVELTSYTVKTSENSSDISVNVSHLTASWKSDLDKTVLKNISFHLDKRARLLAVVGPVGTGKSTLLQCLLGELSLLEGSVQMNGRISYSPQDPWVFTGSLRENILFGQPYEREQYNKVVKACALDKDIELMVNGDLTLVGERGVTLSGGQKARVNLARAVYREADIYLLDDPLSAVDAAVGKHLFEECIRDLLKDKLVILVTHQIHFALQGDKLLILKNGEIQEYGTHDELAARKFDTNQLFGLLHEKDERDEFTYKDGEEADLEEEAEHKFGRMVSVEDQRSPARHKLVKFKSVEEDQVSLHSTASVATMDSEAEAEMQLESQRGTIAPPTEEQAHGSISMRTYVRFFRSGANYFVLFFMLIFFFFGEAGIVMTDWWLSDWVSCIHLLGFNDSRAVESVGSLACPLSQDVRLILYATIIVSCLLLNFLRGIMFYLICINASRVLHNRMFRAILRIPVLFFDTNPSGRVLNRFSKDVGFLDDLLPQSFIEYLLLLVRFIAIIIVVSAGNPFFLIPLPVIGAVFLAFRWYFLKTSRSVKRLEAIARSPVYSHISATLQGLPTIRTFAQQDIATSHFHTFNNEHTQGWYLFVVMTRWFGLRLDFLSSCILIVVVFISLPLVTTNTGTNLDPALLSLGLTYTISLAGMFQYCVRQSTEVENTMISCERIMEYSRLESEAPLETQPPNKKPPQDWPSKGELHLEDVAFRYSSELPMVLKNLNFSVRPSEKVGIVGRTGAGKSSLLSVLYRLAEPYGQITIDGVDTKTIGLHDLRKKMSIIPQDPVLFSGSMRYNLDPFEEYSDAQLWEVLEQVQLKAAVQEIEGQLSGEVTEGGSNFSVGQRQLVCLARALLRKNKILILDEATANVDSRTDSIIQEAIREKFTQCTVLTIAHRLNTIMDSDRILVMSNGQVKEFASPYRLLQNPESQLYKMVEKTGPEASKKLHEMATTARARANRKQSIL